MQNFRPAVVNATETVCKPEFMTLKLTHKTGAAQPVNAMAELVEKRMEEVQEGFPAGARCRVDKPVAGNFPETGQRELCMRSMRALVSVFKSETSRYRA